MIDEIIKRAKYLQDKEYKEMTSFQPDISKFQLDLVEGLKSFVDLAKEKEVTGVDYKELKDLGEGTREFRFQVIEVDYVLVMKEKVFQIDFTSKNIGNLAYLYFDGDYSNTPHIEISIYKDSTNAKFCSASWFSNNNKKMITGNLKLDKNSGVKVAESIISFFYRLVWYWIDKPSREDFSSKKSKKGTMDYRELSPPK